MTPLLAFTIFAVVSLLFVGGLWIAYAAYYGSRARRFGYASRSAYLRALPQSDDEKREAVDQMLKGFIISLVGIVFFPLLFVGLFPLYIGARKTIYALMGLGLLDDSRAPRA